MRIAVFAAVALIVATQIGCAWWIVEAINGTDHVGALEQIDHTLGGISQTLDDAVGKKPRRAFEQQELQQQDWLSHPGPGFK